MIDIVTQDISYFLMYPNSSWDDISEPLNRPQTSNTTPTYPHSLISSTPNDPPETLNTTQDIGNSHTTSNEPPIIENQTLIGSGIQNIIVVEPSSELVISIDNEPIESKANILLIGEDNGLNQIKSEINNSHNTCQDTPTIKAELDKSFFMPWNHTSPVVSQSPKTAINIKAEFDTYSQPNEIETPYYPDMDISDTDSNYDASNSDYSDFENLEGNCLETREKKYHLTYGNIWKYIPPRRYIYPFG